MGPVKVGVGGGMQGLGNRDAGLGVVFEDVRSHPIPNLASKADNLQKQQQRNSNGCLF